MSSFNKTAGVSECSLTFFPPGVMPFKTFFCFPYRQKHGQQLNLFFTKFDLIQPMTDKLDFAEKSHFYHGTTEVLRRTKNASFSTFQNFRNLPFLQNIQSNVRPTFVFIHFASDISWSMRWDVFQQACTKLFHLHSAYEKASHIDEKSVVFKQPERRENRSKLHSHQNTYLVSQQKKFKAGPPWFEFLVIFDFFAPWYRRGWEASSVKIL